MGELATSHIHMTAVLLVWTVASPVTGVPQSPKDPASASAAAPPWQFRGSHPRQYITHALQPSEHIRIDGKLDDAAWDAVNWTDPMEDIAQSFYPGLEIPPGYATMMKVR